MKSKNTILVLLLLGSVVGSGPALCNPARGATERYVATDGNDRWSGTLDRPNTERTDGPWATLAGARDAIRRERAAGRLAPGPVTIHVRGGVYHLETPLVFEPADSGTPDGPVLFEAYSGEHPVISGGRVLGALRHEGSLWKCTIPEARDRRWPFRQLFADGKRCTPARSPNEGYFRVADLLPGPRGHRDEAVARDRFVFAAGDLKPWARLGDVNLILMHSWETSIHPLKSVDATAHVVELAAPLKEWWTIGYWEKAQRYYVENALEFLDQPGEWYLDRELGTLSYWPRPGEELSTTRIVAPRLSELVRFAGNANEGRFVDHVTLRGLAFHHADWLLSPQGNSSTQAAVEVPAAIVADGARHCSIESCEVAHVGTYAIWLRRGCKDCRIARNRLFDLGAGGIRVGEPSAAETDAAETSRIVVDNNHIFDGGHVFAAGIGIWVAQSSGNRITHNDIHDLKYSGMSVGWNWDDAPNRTHHNLIERNHVHNLGHGVLSDAGLIYCLGVSPGSVIRENVFHDMWPYTNPPFGWGIYLDATCGGYLVERNLVYNTLSGGLMYNNGGHEHVIQDNVFALSANHTLWPFSAKRPNVFRRNIVYLTQGELLIPLGERSLNERLAAHESLGEWDRNLYWHAAGADRLRFYQQRFDQWRALGLDTHSLIADPRFVDVAHHDFRLQSSSPALTLGFQTLDPKCVGLYGDPAWASEASHARCPHIALPPPPPPPQPQEISDDFESTPPERHPAHAHTSGEERGASIAVSTEQAAGGQHSLRVRDSKSLQPTWQPHFFYEPHMADGLVRQSFDAWLEPGARFFTEWRDTTAYPQNVGPSVQLDGSGAVSIAGKQVGTIPVRAWIHIELEARLGKGSPRTFKLTVVPHGGAAQVIDHLAFGGSDFHELQWLGFSSTSEQDSTFFLDNLQLRRIRLAH